MNKVNEITTQTNIFKIVLRKNIVYDTNGNLVKEFYIYVKDKQIYSPIITKGENGCSINNSTIFTYINIAFDVNLEFNPYTLWMNGELSIMNEYLTDSLQTEKAIKCSIIKADNALKLHKSDVMYLYKPNTITEDNEYYKMIYKIPSNYTIPTNLQFKFNEYCFGNKWDLIWNGTKWDGNNIQGRSNGMIINKCNSRAYKKSSEGEQGAMIMIKKSEWNLKFINDTSIVEQEGYMQQFYTICSKNDYILFKDGSLKSAHDYGLWIRSTGLQSLDNRGLSYTKDKTYDWMCFCGVLMKEKADLLDLSQISLLYMDLIAPNCDIANRLSFKLDNTTKHNNTKIGLYYYLDLVGVDDTIEKIFYRYEDSNITTRDIELYLKKDLVDPIEEVNWDQQTNPFKYIIDQQFYEITPNPNAATTLYTDYNITSSKIITADNITTMRSDLNIVTNNLDVVSYDLTEMNHKVNVLNSEMTEVKDITQHLENDVKNLRIVSYTALAFGIVGTVSSATSIGMQLFPHGIKMISSFFRGLFDKVRVAGAPNWTRLQMILGNPAIRSISTDISPIIEWCNSSYKQLDDITFENEDDNPNEYSVSVESAYEIGNQFRETLKPVFKLLVEKINEIEAEFNYYPTIDVINEGLKNAILKDELVRDDIIDVVGRYVNKEIHLEAQDTITDGTIKVRF